MAKGDRDERFERWLGTVSSWLGARQVPGRLIYEDRFKGDLMALPAQTVAGSVELQVHRQAHGAVLLVFSDCRESAGALSHALDGAHRSIKRRHNAKRKFVHRLERMAQHLALTFDQRHQTFPAEPFARFQQWVARSRPMTGIEGLYRAKGHEEGTQAFRAVDASTAVAREAHKYPTQHAAAIPSRGGWRAALHRQGHFVLGATPITQERLAAARQRKQSDEVDAEDLVDTVDIAAEVGDVAAGVGEIALDTTTGAGDCGGIDFPDCSFDMPDCGGCDCG